MSVTCHSIRTTIFYSHFTGHNKLFLRFIIKWFTRSHRRFDKQSSNMADTAMEPSISYPLFPRTLGHNKLLCGLIRSLVIIHYYAGLYACNIKRAERVDLTGVRAVTNGPLPLVPCTRLMPHISSYIAGDHEGVLVPRHVKGVE